MLNLKRALHFKDSHFRFHQHEETELPEVNIADGAVACMRLFDVVIFRDFYSPGVLYFLHTLLEGTNASIDQFNVNPSFSGRRYGELVTRLIDTEDCSSLLFPDFDPASATRVATMLPLGLLRRSHTLLYSKDPCNYVFTNP